MLEGLAPELEWVTARIARHETKPPERDRAAEQVGGAGVFRFQLGKRSGID